MDIVNSIKSIDDIVSEFTTVDRPSVVTFINDALKRDADVPIIMSTILDKFTTTTGTIFTNTTFNSNDFKSFICLPDSSNRNIRGYTPFLTETQYYNELTSMQRTKLWRITNTLFSMCKSIDSDKCKIDEIVKFYTNYKADNVDVTNIKSASTEADLEAALNALNTMRISGGNQTGGNTAQIATLLAGIDAAVLKISSLSEAAYKTLCELCQKTASIISGISLSNCLRIIMGDILYTCVKNVIDVAIDIQPGLFETGARATIGLLGPYAVYTNRMALLNVLSSMISYLPQAGGLCVATVAGVIVFNTSMQAIEKAPSVAETSIILKEYISTLNNLDASDIITGFTKLQKIISNHLTAASKAGDTQKEQALEEFRATITEILNNADLTPKALAESSTRKDEQDIMTINIRKSIFANLQSKFADCKDITVPGCLDRAKQIVELGDAIIKDAAVVNTTIVDEGKKIKVDKINVDAIRATVTAEEARLTEKERSAEKERRRAINQAIAERINRDETAKAAVRAANALKRKQDNNDLNSRNAADTIKTNLIHQIQNTAVTDAAINAAKKPKIKGEEPDVINFGGKPRRKTTRKPHKKNNKKSRKHRRSRKH